MIRERSFLGGEWIVADQRKEYSTVVGGWIVDDQRKEFSRWRMDCR